MLHARVDLLWVVLSSLLVVGASIWAARRSRRWLDLAGLAATCFVLIAASRFIADYAASREGEEVEQRLLGLASVYATETERLGHARVGFGPASDEAVYGTLIDRQIGWLEANPQISDIYTYRYAPSGKVAFLVDSETDYDRNGLYDGETEARTTIGETVEAGADMRRALHGVASFRRDPYTDRWGTWVSAFVPLRDASGAVEGGLGVDFPAEDWLADQAEERLHVYAVAGALLLLNLIGGIAVLRGRDVRARLEIAYENAQAGARAKADFLAVMSHEIRTPLNGVLGMTELLLRGALGEPRRGYVQAIDDSARHLLGLLNDVLEFSRGENRAVQFSATPIALREVAEEVVRMHAATAHAKGVEVTAIVDPSLSGSHLVDRLRLKQILVNLVGNAVKFTERGEITLELTRRAAGDVERVSFSVRDSGVGIPAHALRTIFAPFQQADGSTARRYGGSGLGLAISQRLVEGLGGTLQVESQEGLGSRFWFELALPRAADCATQTPRGEAGPRVLLIAANPVLRQSVADMLQRLAIRTAGAIDATDALAEMERAAGSGDPFRVAIIDEHGTDGTALARQLRERDPDLRLVLLSAMDRAARHTQGPCDRVLLKPPRASELFDTIQTLIGSRAAPLREERAPSSAWAGRRVLLVEDNAINRRVACAMLEALGCRAEIAEDGERALARVGEAFDLVLMDCQMPVLDGYDATRAWRRREPAPRRTPIVALTAHALPGEHEKCLAAGMDDYATKPLALARLEALLKRWVTPTPHDASVTTSASASEEVVLDAAALDVLRKLAPEDPQFASSIVEEFVDRATTMLADAHAALGQGDAAALRSLAHQLKANCAQLGAGRAAEAALALEQAAAARASAALLGDSLAQLDLHLRAALPALLAAVSAPRA